MIEHISELAAAGITSFKIEGRAKTEYYTAIVTNAYRAAIDAYERGEPCPEWALREVSCVSHRPYCTGFYFGNREDNANIEPTFSGYIRDCDFVGTINGDTITQRNYFTVDDELEVVEPGKPPVKLEIHEMYNSKDELITIANHAVEKLRFAGAGSARPIAQGSMLRRVSSP
jgi:putative protease